MKQLIFVVFLILATGAQAEIIRVESGDHPGFTRLVLNMPPGRDWQLGRQGENYAIDSGDPTDSFDISSVFDLIGRQRLASLDSTSQSGQLKLTLACTCHAIAFRWQTNWVVVDIVDGPAAIGSAFEKTLDANSGTATAAVSPSGTGFVEFEILPPKGMLSAFAIFPTSEPAPETNTRLVLPLILQSPASAETLPLLPDNLGFNSEPGAVPTGQDRESGDLIGETERGIIESFARAASQGLLDISAPAELPERREFENDRERPETTDMAATPDAMSDPADETEPSPVKSAGMLESFDLRAVNTDVPGINYRTGRDQNTLSTEPSGPSSAVGDRCLDPGLFDMEAWGDERDFSTQVGERMSALTTEFDEFGEGAVEGLARTFIYFGLGQEALQAVKLDGVDSQQRRVLASMAYVVDGEPDPSGLLSSQLGCATPVAIWTTLSRGTFADTTEAERIAATEGFRTLPRMLRGHLGLRLAQIFADFGDPDTANSILESARNLVTTDRAATDVTSAEISLLTMGAKAAIPALNTLASEDIRLTPEALIQLINLTIEDGQTLDPTLITLADSMAYEHRGEPVRAALIAAQAQALTAIEAFDQVFALLDSDVSPMEPEQLFALRTAAILSLVQKSDDAAFLNFAFDPLPETRNPEVENAVSTRLLGLGFAERAKQILESPAAGAAARDRNYLAAEIAVEAGDFAAVETLLGGATDPRAAEIRARALAAQGDFAAASSVLSDMPGTVPAPSEAWRAGQWSALGQSDDPLLQAASEAILTPPESLDPETPLAASRALLEQATATQALAGQLLDRFSIEPETIPSASN